MKREAALGVNTYAPEVKCNEQGNEKGRDGRVTYPDCRLVLGAIRFMGRVVSPLCTAAYMQGWYVMKCLGCPKLSLED
jgi:hypothetical protein